MLPPRARRPVRGAVAAVGLAASVLAGLLATLAVGVLAGVATGAAVVGLLDEVVRMGPPRSRPVWATVALVVGVLIVGRQLVEAFPGAWRAHGRITDGPEPIGGPDPVVEETVDDLAASTDLPRPDVLVADARDPFAYAVDRGDGPLVVVSADVVEALDDDELEAVLAHELAHVDAGDVRSVTAALFLFSFLVALAGAEFDRDSSLVYLVGNVLLYVSSLGVSLVAVPLLDVSTAAFGVYARERQLAADREAARVVGDTESLESALIEVRSRSSTIDGRVGNDHISLLSPSDYQGVRRSFVSNYSGSRVPLSVRGRADAINVVGVSAGPSSVVRHLPWSDRWCATHPSLERRVEQLRRIDPDRIRIDLGRGPD